MPTYTCIICDFKSYYKNSYKAHLKTQKHINNSIMSDSKNENQDSFFCKKKEGSIKLDDSDEEKKKLYF